ncbi:TPA: hypothetical protein HA251_07525 [Candidatus Woesearchaeota archaeon]|nr:hypothetical protein [Candidatus Woesearchaeota archaeon]
MGEPRAVILRIVKRNAVSPSGRDGGRGGAKGGAVSLDPRLREPQALAALRTAFRRDGAIAISGALTAASLRALHAATSRGFTRTFVPDRYSYGAMPLHADMGGIVSFVESITGSSSKMSGLGAIPAGSVARFGHGDYTLLHDNLPVAPAHRIVAFVVIDDWDASSGGDIVWTRDGETLLRLSIMKNILYVIREEKGSRAFVKYVNHRAGRTSFRLILLS